MAVPLVGYNPGDTVYIPGQFQNSDWIAWMDGYELAIYEEEAARAARNEPPVPSVSPDPVAGN